jgi:endonuclease G
MNQYLKIKVCIWLSVVTLYTVNASAQDTVTVRHERYTTTFDTTLKYPVLVHWTVTTNNLCTKQDANRVERSVGSFKPDPKLRASTNLQKYYTKNIGKYQRGHGMDAADNSCSLQQMKECFYFSNMTPQTKELNEGVWGDLEDFTRKLVKRYGAVEIWCGSYAFKEKMGRVTVPMFCWKIIRYNGQEIAFIFPNDHKVNLHSYGFYSTTVDAIRKASGLRLKGLQLVH